MTTVGRHSLVLLVRRTTALRNVVGEDTGNCPVCGCEFTMKLHRFKSKSNNYCSKRCNARDRRGSRSGNWQGGLSGDTKEVG